MTRPCVNVGWKSSRNMLSIADVVELSEVIATDVHILCKIFL